MTPSGSGDLGPCPLCGRPMIDGPSVDRHHWIPKSEGGDDAVPLHRVCHRMLHRVLSETEMANAFNTPEALRAHPEIERFIRWVRGKPPEYVDWPRRSERERKPRNGR